MFDEKEKRIAEKRTIEATRKGYMGAGGRFAIIAKHLGEAIINQSDGSDFYSINYLPNHDAPRHSEHDQSAEAIQSRIPYMAGSDLDEPSGYGWRQDRNYDVPYTTRICEGWHFDGLRRGIHMEIKLSEEESEISVHWKGYLVYHEKSGELFAYVPTPEWESKIGNLYETAKSRQKDSIETERDERRQIAEVNKKHWLLRVREKWGI